MSNCDSTNTNVYHSGEQFEMVTPEKHFKNPQNGLFYKKYMQMFENIKADYTLKEIINKIFNKINDN